MKREETTNPEANTIRARGLSFLVAVQISMLVMLNVFDYSYIFPSRSGLTIRHQLLFCGIYVVALVWGRLAPFGASVGQLGRHKS